MVMNDPSVALNKCSKSEVTNGGEEGGREEVSQKHELALMCFIFVITTYRSTDTGVIMHSQGRQCAIHVQSACSIPAMQALLDRARRAGYPCIFIKNGFPMYSTRSILLCECSSLLPHQGPQCSAHCYCDTHAGDAPIHCKLLLMHAGLRALIKKDAAVLSRLIQQENVDVLCLQETKLQVKNIEEVNSQLNLPGWSANWCCSMDKLGYAGVVTLYRTAAFSEELKVTSGMGAPEHDGEGRVITLEMPDMYLVNVYVPNSGEHRLESRRSCHAANNRPCFCWICSHDEHLLDLGWCELALHCRLQLQCSAWVHGASSPTAAFLPVLQSFHPVHVLPPAAA
jgi:hypothetical protein